MLNIQKNSFLKIAIPAIKLLITYFAVEMMFKCFTLPSTLLNFAGIGILIFIVWAIRYWIYPICKELVLKINNTLNN